MCQLFVRAAPGISALPCSGPARAEQKIWQIGEFLIRNVTLHTCSLQGETTHLTALPCTMVLCRQKNMLEGRYFGNRKEEKKETIMCE